MTDSTIRLWDHDFAFLAAEDVPNAAIKDYGEQIEIAITNAVNSPIRLAIVKGRHQAGYLPNLHITIDDDEQRRGGILCQIQFNAGTLILTMGVHSRALQQPEPETIYPPRGYGIALPGRGNADHAIIGCWATEDEARAAITKLRIVALGNARPNWDTNEHSHLPGIDCPACIGDPRLTQTPSEDR